MTVLEATVIELSMKNRELENEVKSLKQLPSQPEHHQQPNDFAAGSTVGSHFSNKSVTACGQYKGFFLPFVEQSLHN